MQLVPSPIAVLPGCTVLAVAVPHCAPAATAGGTLAGSSGPLSSRSNTPSQLHLRTSHSSTALSSMASGGGGAVGGLLGPPAGSLYGR